MGYVIVFLGNTTVMCSLLYYEVINQFLCNGNHVYSCLTLLKRLKGLIMVECLHISK